MTKLLEKAIERMKRLEASEQDAIAAVAIEQWVGGTAIPSFGFGSVHMQNTKG